MRRVLFSALIAAAAAGAGIAGAQPADLAGQWSFHTQPFNGCVIQGEMTIKRVNDKKYVCTFKTSQNCGADVGGAEQTCTIDRNGAAVKIRSKVIKFTWESGSYAPDDFDLTIVSSSYMKGGFSSVHTATVDEAFAEFHRGQAPNS
jgi:hypothetical protein